MRWSRSGTFLSRDVTVGSRGLPRARDGDHNVLAAPRSDLMRLATWNLNRSNSRSVRYERMKPMMAEADADVWVLTETHIDVAPSPDHRLISYSADALDGKSAQGECWVAVWSRLPADVVPLLADRERTAAVRIGGSIVIGTVLPWGSDDRDPELRGEAAFRARLAEQSADWQRVGATADGLCVAGDFNQDLLAEGHNYGSNGGRRALRDALGAVGLDCLTGGKDDPLGGTPALACIDHVCVRGLRAQGRPRSNAWPPPGTLQKNTLTDHYGVWADLVEI